MPQALRIDDALLEALADRWPFIPRDFRGQTFEGWLSTRMLEFNEFGYAHYGESGVRSLWDVVAQYPPATFEDMVTSKANELREMGGTFIQAARDLKPLAVVAIQLGV